MSRYRGSKLRLDAGIGLVYAELSLDHRRNQLALYFLLATFKKETLLHEAGGRTAILACGDRDYNQSTQ